MSIEILGDRSHRHLGELVAQREFRMVEDEREGAGRVFLGSRDETAREIGAHGKLQVVNGGRAIGQDAARFVARVNIAATAASWVDSP